MFVLCVFLWTYVEGFFNRLTPIEGLIGRTTRDFFNGRAPFFYISPVVRARSDMRVGATPSRRVRWILTQLSVIAMGGTSFRGLSDAGSGLASLCHAGLSTACAFRSGPL